MKWILSLVALLCMSAGANNDVLHSAKLNFIQGKKAYNQKNYVYAKRLYRRACDKGLSDVCNTLAFMYLDGTIDSNTPEMLTVLKKGCEGDNALGCMLLATHSTQESDATQAVEAKAKGCKLLENSTPQWQAQGKMEKWNCFATVEPEESMAEPLSSDSEIFSDSRTGLIWQDDGDAKSIMKNWHNARSYCTHLTLAGYSDWYLPNKEQLLKLSKKNNELKNKSANFYWSSTELEDTDFGAWGVHLEKERDIWGEKSGKVYVRCVRGEPKQVKSLDTKPLNNYTLKFKNKCGDSIGIAYKVKKEDGVEISHSLHKMNPDEIYSIPNIVENEIYYFAKAIYKNNVWGGKYTNRLGNGERYGFGKIKMNLTGYTGTHILDITCSNNNQKKYKIIKVASNDTLNVRSDAGTQNRKIDELTHNARGVKVLHCKKAPDGRKWCKVKHYSISTGWVSAWYLKLQ